MTKLRRVMVFAVAAMIVATVFVATRADAGSTTFQFLGGQVAVSPNTTLSVVVQNPTSGQRTASVVYRDQAGNALDTDALVIAANGFGVSQFECGGSTCGLTMTMTTKTSSLAPSAAYTDFITGPTRIPPGAWRVVKH